MVRVPAAMELLGEANWWLPGWLERIPRLRLRVDGRSSPADLEDILGPDEEREPALAR